MANVQFKRGTQASLEALLAKQGTAGSYVEGAFYLTTDSDRLYFAQSDKELVHLNHNVIHVANISALPTLADAITGDFYYCVAENVLCTKKAGATEWTQINKNTNDDHDTSVTGLTVSANADESNNIITLSYAVKQAFKNLLTNATDPVQDVTASVTLSQADLDKVLDLATNVTASVSGGTATIKTNGRGSGGSGFTMKGAGSVTVGGGADAITITGVNTTYGISKDADSANVVLKGSDNKTSEIEFTAGTDLETVNTAANTVTYKHAPVTHTQATPAQASVSHGGTFTAISDITVSATGHVTGSTKQVYKLPVDKYAKAIAVDKTGTNGNITVTMADNSTFSDNNALFYKIENVDGTTDTFYNGAVLNVYSKEDIDDKFLGVNAMTYKGVVGTVALPTAGVHIGDTYMVDKVGTYGGSPCKIGDLLIATGTEANGVITSDTLKWTMVPSANDTDTQFALSVASTTNGGQIVLKNTTASKQVGSAIIEGGDQILVSPTTGPDGKIKISHKEFNPGELNTTPDTATNLTHGGTFDVLTRITNEQGHVTGYHTQKFKLPSDNNTTYGIEVGGTKDAATIVLKGNNNTTDSVTIAGGSRIDANVATDKITIAHEAITVAKTDKTATADTVAVTHGGTFDAITAITSSDGHLEGYTVQKFKLPADNNTTNSSLTQSTAVTAGNATTPTSAVVTTSLKDSANKTLTATTTIQSSSLAVKAYSTNKGFSIDLEWGSF